MAWTRESAIIEVGATETTILQPGASETAVVVSLILGNVDGTNGGTVTLHLTKSGGSTIDMVVDIPLAAGEALEFFIGGKGSLFLESSDELSATAGGADDIVATISYLLDS